MLFACGEGEGPLLTIQFCVKNDDGVAAFKQTLQAIALEQGMTYVDSSGKTMRELRTIGATGKDMHASGGLINVHLEGDEGLGLSAGNLGLNLYDVAVGFSPEPNHDVANHFADFVVARLGRNWTVRTIARGTGALPDPTCMPTTSEALAPPNKALQTDKGKLSCLLHSQKLRQLAFADELGR